MEEAEVKMRRLSNDEAQKMFNKRVDADIMRHPEIKGCAALLVKECGGMPVLINMIALKLARIDDPAVWRDTLSQLQAPTMERHEQLQDFIRFFDLVYDNLKDTEKRCLLYWEIFPIGYQIHRDYIIECRRTEQLFDEYSRLGATRDRGHSILNEFVETGLLERGKKSRHYKMFEIFQSITRRIANHKRGSQDMVSVKKARDKIKDDEWSNAKKISLISHRFSTLPKEPQCSDILTLLLQENQHLTTITESFFTCIEKFQLLDLLDTRIKSLPHLISSLRKLKSVYLNDCKELEELTCEIVPLQKGECLTEG